MLVDLSQKAVQVQIFFLIVMFWYFVMQEKERGGGRNWNNVNNSFIFHIFLIFKM